MRRKGEPRRFGSGDSDERKDAQLNEEALSPNVGWHERFVNDLGARLEDRNDFGLALDREIEVTQEVLPQANESIWRRMARLF